MSEADAERRDRIADRIEEWHDVGEWGGSLDGPLHEALGWTWEEYTAFVERGELPREREGAF